MKFLFTLICCLAIFQYVSAQKDSSFLNDVNSFQKELTNEYSNPKTSPLSAEAKKEFKGIHFFAADEQYVVKAKFTRTPNEKIIAMPTSGSSTKSFVKYARVQFTMQGKEYTLSVYQSVELASQRKYRDYLFIPFRDLTSGKETYGGGRYIDLTIPQSDSIVINFNKAYQPYCAYTEGYSCPIPPRENYLPLKIEAGVKF